MAVLSKYFAGLAVFTAKRSLNETGVRKVLGASEFNIVYLLSGDFTELVLASVLLAFPVSYLPVKYWLDNFAQAINRLFADVINSPPPSKG